MNNLTITKKILLGLIFTAIRFLNFININISTLLVMLFSTAISFVIWNNRNLSLDEAMKFTRRKPVQDLSETIPESVLVKKTEAATVVKATMPPKNIYKLKTTSVLARSYIVYDTNDRRIIDKRNEELKLPPASLVKLLSVMMFERNKDYQMKLEVPAECTIVNGQKVGLKAKEKVSIKDLVYSSLIFSGADSICTLSKYSSLSLTDFNNYARDIGMKNSNFTNYIGLDFETNYTTSNDMLAMTLEFLKNNNLNQIVAIKSYKLENGINTYNTNKMLFEEPYTVGIKTGTTGGANENLIYRYQNKELKKDFIIIILNSSNRYQDVRNILNNLYLDAE